MRRAFSVSMAPVVIAASAFGQAISVNGGAIQGTITDPSGAKIPGAVLVVTSVDEGTTRTIKTDSAGFYSVGPLNPGSYKVHVTAAGFQGLQVNTVIRTGTVSSGDFKLTVGQSSETVEVNAGAVQVNTDQIAVQDVITRQQIDSLPVNGRNFLDIAQIEPGVQLQSGQSFDPTKAGYSAISVSGVSGRTTRLILDGQDITDETVGTTLFNVSEGSIDEFQLNRATQDVSGDVTSTGEVLVATRSGTNTFHGMAYYNFQDYRALFASQTPGQPSSEFQRNQYGGSVGGPILRDKLFYFANLERIQQSQAAPSNLGTLFAGTASSFGVQYSTYQTPYRDTYTAIRLDGSGPLGGHYFVRGNYNFNGGVANANDNFQTYVNRDNTWGGAGGADFASGRFTHSFRGSYEKFHNFIADDTIGNPSVYNPFSPQFGYAGDGMTLRYSAQNLFVGPNVDAPQATYQSDKQFRYDGTWTHKAQSIKYGFSMNRIQDGGFAAFYGLAPRFTETVSTLLAGKVTTANPLGLGCNGTPGAAACPNDPINGYDASTLTIGNGQGFSTEIPGFGLKGGDSPSWRFGAYLADSFKLTPNFTAIAGLRWSVDTNRENNDLAAPTCSQLTTTVAAACTGLAATTSLYTLWNPGFTGRIHQPYGNFGPQVGFNYSPGDHKTSLHGGAGIYYENDVFNNLINSRGNLLQSGAFYASKAVCSSFQVTFPDGTVHKTSPDGTSLQVLCQEETAKQAAPQFIALQQQYQANTLANSSVTNGSYVGNTLSASGLFAPDYRTPYSEQISFGVQRQIFRGAVLSADYVHDATLKIGQTVDLNHLGAARTFNLANATTAVNNTVQTLCKGTSVQQVITPGGCASGSGSTTVNGVTQHYATISDFAKQGLDSASVYDSGTNYLYAGRTNPGAFPGVNPNLGSGAFIQPSGRSGYDALQVVFREQKAHPVRFVENSNLQVSYSLSRITSTAGGGTSDEFFTNAAYDNDHPTEFMGRSGLDRTNQISFGGSLSLKYGPQVGFIGHFNSATPSNLALDTELANGGIFQTDVTGDGTVGDIAPGTLPGYYMHHIKGNTLQQYISNFNATQAGTLTPAGKAVASSGLITAAQLQQIGAAVQPIANLPQATGLNNPAFRSADINLSYPLRLTRLREGLSIVPEIAFYNVGNFSNFSNPTATLLNTTSTGGATNTSSGYITGVNNFGVLSTERVIRGSGTYDQGAPRSAEFQLHINF